MNITDEQLGRFMLESNAIEGEVGLNPKDIEAARNAIDYGFSLDNLLSIHKLLTQHLGVKWSGKFREVNVRVGDYKPYDWEEVPQMMNEFFVDDYPDMDSWEAHKRFEQIHPFQDFNGRIGRLIWLSKAVKEGYDFSRPFLHQYYYQTLNH